MSSKKSKVVALTIFTLLASGCSSGSQSGSKAQITFSNASESLISVSDLPFDANLKDQVATSSMDDYENVFLEPDLSTIEACNQLSEISDEIKIYASWKVTRSLVSIPKDHEAGFSGSDVGILQSIYKFDETKNVKQIVNLAKEGLTNPSCFIKAVPDGFALNVVSGDGPKEIGKIGDESVFVRQTSIMSDENPNHEDLDFSYCSVLVANKDILVVVRVGVDSHGIDDDTLYAIIKNSLEKIFKK